MVFQVIGMALLRWIRSKSQVVVTLYVDDFMGFGTLPQCMHDQSFSLSCTQQTLGSDEIAAGKTVPPTQKTVLLGWEVTINKGGAWIRPLPKAINKILFVFFCFDATKGQPQSLWDIICGVAERYSNGVLGMRCCVSALHKMKGLASKRPFSYYVTASSEAKFDIEMWRIVALLMWANPDSFSLSIEMFTHRYDITKSISNRSVYTITDASGWRICVALYDTATHALIAAMVILSVSI